MGHLYILVLKFKTEIYNRGLKFKPRFPKEKADTLNG